MIHSTEDQLRAALADGVIAPEQALRVRWQRGERLIRDSSTAAIYDLTGSPVIGGVWTRLADALDVASQKTGIEDWIKNRRGDYVPAIVQERYPIPPRR